MERTVLTCPDGFKRSVPFRNPSGMGFRKPLSLQCPKAGFWLFRNHQFAVRSQLEIDLPWGLLRRWRETDLSGPAVNEWRVWHAWAWPPSLRGDLRSTLFEMLL